MLESLFLWKHISHFWRVCGCKRFEICSVETWLLKTVSTAQNHIHIGWKKARGLTESSYLPLCPWLYLNITYRKHIHIPHVVKEHFWVHVLLLLLLLSRFSRVWLFATHGLQPTRLPRPWDSPGKNTGVGCHFLLQCMKVKSPSEVAQSCPILCDPVDCSPPGSSAHGIFQARVLEWGAIAFSGSCTREP